MGHATIHARLTYLRGTTSRNEKGMDTPYVLIVLFIIIIKI